MISIISSNCGNKYRKFAEKIKFSQSDIENFDYKGKTRSILLKFCDNEFNISNRKVLIRLNSYNIYNGEFKEHEEIQVHIPEILINKYVSPSIAIIEPNRNEAYYFESKDVFVVKESDTLICVSLTPARDYSDRVRITMN